jgi:ADP-ribosylglycohydrolase
VMWAAAAHGGDSDSTASIAGNLLGAMGARFPTTWTDELELRDVIEALSRRLSAG